LSTTPQASITPGACAILRCHHIKTNGVQCGSPALRTERHCFFHNQHRRRTYEYDPYEPVKSALNLPALEDANSIQLGLAELMRLIVTQQIEQPAASLLLRVLRTAVSNLKLLSLEPKPTHVVIDPNCVENRPLGATAWSTVEGQEYDILADTNDADNNHGHDLDKEKEERDSMADLDDPNNPDALEYRAFMLRVTAAVEADHEAIHLSSREIYHVNPSILSRTEYYPDSQRPNAESPSTPPEPPASTEC
jgi:hypothetical protein